MSARATPYPEPNYRIRIPAPVWEVGMRTIREYGTLNSEGLVFFAGVVASTHDIVVTAIYRLGHKPQGDTVVVTKAEARWLVRTLRDRDEKLVGQLHSHRGRAGHSWGDDAHATSFHSGFLSFVVPHFGKRSTDPRDCAVLEFRNGTFEQLSVDEVQQRISIVNRTVDHSPMSGGRTSWWKRFVQKLKRTGPRPR